MTAPPLRRIYAYLTEGCNLSCQHCWLAPRRHEEGRSRVLNADLFRRVTAEALPLGLEGVKLCGGEPLLHPDFAEFVETIDRSGLDCHIETNGLLLDEETARSLAALQRCLVSVSIDGRTADTHDGIRGRKGSFAAACRAVELLAARGAAPQVIFTLMRENASELDSLPKLATELGASSLKVNVLQPTGRGESLGWRGGALGVEEVLRSAGRFTDDVDGLTIFFDVPAAFRPLRRLGPDGDNGFCGIHGIIGLLPDGAYALCGIGEQVPDLVFGHASRNTLREIWEQHPVLQEIRQGLPARLSGICGRCLVNGRCLGSCLAQNYYRRGDLWAPHWFCEEAEARGLFPASRLAAP